MNIVHIAAEVYPFSKVGGLGDVLGALPRAQWKAGDRVCVITPLYKEVIDKKYELKRISLEFDVWIGGKKRKCRVFEYSYDSTYKVYFLFNRSLFAKGGVYTESDGSPLANSTERFVFFQKAALRVVSCLAKDADIIHCHDNHVAVLPLYKKLRYKNLRARTFFTIHNIGYQGVADMREKGLFGLPGSYFRKGGDLFWQGSINPMKAGIIHADAVGTVSPTHAREILESDELSAGMREIFVRTGRKLYGVLNGVDYDEWSPEKDRFIWKNYSMSSLDSKQENKKRLIAELGVDVSLEERPLIGMVSRLVEQKGVDILLEAIPSIVSLGCGLVVLGKGNRKYEEKLKNYQERYKGAVCVRIGYDYPLSHRIIAGTDFFVVPSRYEPCGVTQMYSMRYGTIPIVRKTGGLADTVKDWDGKEGTGIVFEEYCAEELFKAIRKAVNIYRNRDLHREISCNGMRMRFSWDKSAGEYRKLYAKLIES